ncbi:DUF2802 domain-containing protein [Lacimicrobium alkaliphilum]|uniref:DNA repair protein n=1 Tax=Lacimicrobium alkaliphilum TaxID=1526571 RepID=A0A0U3B6T8_9ALTE|nr:DUF2802 domain-containing protein [Lacimicrobium alkaliphilum]ALS99273.1 hypothetical protein AT746_14085 [Lacimicrobium alkaliphilum]
MTLIEISLIALFVVLGLGIVLLAWRQQSQRAGFSALSAQLQEQQQQLAILQEAIHELRTGSIGVGKKVKALEAQLVQLQQKQQELEEMEPDSKLYTGAVKLLQRGASVEEVMQECELPRAEAELLFSIHGKG